MHDLDNYTHMIEDFLQQWKIRLLFIFLNIQPVFAKRCKLLVLFTHFSVTGHLQISSRQTQKGPEKKRQTQGHLPFIVYTVVLVDV